MKKQPTRKKTALRRAALLALILLAASVLDLMNLIPRQSVWDMADTRDIQHPKIIETYYDDSLPAARFALQHLVDGDDAMMLCSTGWNLFMGWYDRDWCKVETWDGAPIHAGIRIHSLGELHTADLFGRIDNGYITSLTLTFNAITTPAGQGVVRTPCVIEIPEDAVFRAKNDQKYLLTPIVLPYDLLDVDYPNFQDFRIIGYDHEGKVIADEEVFCQSWSTSSPSA